MVKVAGAVAAAAGTTTVPAWIVVLVVTAGLADGLLPDPVREITTTPNPMTKTARPMRSIWVDRRIAMGAPRTIGSGGRQLGSMGVVRTKGRVGPVIL